MKVAVIDISSSAVSFIVAATEGSNAEILFKDRFALSLRQYMQGQSVSARGMEKLINAIASAKRKCAASGVERAYLIGTAALRQIDNFSDVSEAVKNSLGMTINLIDGKTEGYFDLIANECYSVYDKAVMADIGGASIEICDFANSSSEQTRFLGFGIFDLNRKFVKGIQPDKDEAKSIKKYVNKKFDEEKLPEEGEYASVVLVGATNLSVYDVYSDYADEDGEEKRIDVKRFKKLVKHLLGDAGRSALVLKSAPEKVHVIATASVVLNAMFKRFRPVNVIVSDRGVKEGYLRYILEQNGEGEAYDFGDGEVGDKAGKPDKAEKTDNTGKPDKTEKAEKAEGSAPAGAEGEKKARRGRPRKSAAPADEKATKAKRKYTRRKPVQRRTEKTEEEAAESAGEVVAPSDGTDENSRG